LTNMGTIIIGGGIIGTSIAYFLSESSGGPTSIHIVESSSRLFASASGFAAGFLARDWFAPAAAELGALSFKLHQQLAKEHDGSEKWGYTPSTALSLDLQEGVGIGTGQRGEDWLLDGTSRAEVSTRKDMLREDGTPTWLTKQKGGSLEVISSEDGCAQVDPLRLCKFMMEACRARGVQIHFPAEVVSVNKDEQGTVVGVSVSDGGNVPVEFRCKDIVISSGAWTPAVFQNLFPNSTIPVPISPLAGYSLLMQSPRHSLQDENLYGRSHAVFSTPTKAYAWAPEIFSRKGGEIYIAGLNDPKLTLPERATGAIIEDEAMVELKKVAIHLMGPVASDGDQITDNDLEITREALCFRPVAKRGTPIITRLSDIELGGNTKSPAGGGVFIASGHGPWGISLSLGSGKVVAEMICGEETSADISQLGL
jgi:glycine/D-amino acid oxidase-like deaminating enzyme